jgi:hypothetical protein
MGQVHPTVGPVCSENAALATTIRCRTSITSSTKKGTKKSISPRKWRQGSPERRESGDAQNGLTLVTGRVHLTRWPLLCSIGGYRSTEP